jgi:hypothetical protein
MGQGDGVLRAHAEILRQRGRLIAAWVAHSPPTTPIALKIDGKKSEFRPEE